MKKIISITFICFISSINAQQVSLNQVFGDNSVFTGVRSASEKTLKYEEILGSPYFDKDFHEAKVAENYEKINVRYNSYKDEIEFQKDNKIQVLPKQEVFSRIELFNPKTVLVLLETNDLSGYYLELVSGKNILYKKIKTDFIDVVKAANSYASDKPATFKSKEAFYYIKTNSNLIQKPKNQKDFVDSYPELKDKINVFIKDNKIKFGKEEDLIKFVNFLNEN